MRDHDPPTRFAVSVSALVLGKTRPGQPLSPSAQVARQMPRPCPRNHAPSFVIYGGSGFAYARPGNDHMSGGFHLFGGDRQSGSFSHGGSGQRSGGFNFGSGGGYKAPGSGHFGGGGHSSWGGGGGFKAPSGGHFSGGGHSTGGSHSSGGHSSHHR